MEAAVVADEGCWEATDTTKIPPSLDGQSLGKVQNVLKNIWVKWPVDLNPAFMLLDDAAVDRTVLIIDGLFGIHFHPGIPS